MEKFNKLPFYIAVVLALIGCFYFNRHLHAGAFDYDLEMATIDWEMSITEKATGYENLLKEKMHYHELQACIYLNKIEQDIYWCLPDYDDLEKTKLCFTTAMSGLAPGDPKIKMAVMFLTFMTQCGLDVIDRYQEVMYNANRAQYHYDMYVFYVETLENLKKPKRYVIIQNGEEISSSEED